MKKEIRTIKEAENLKMKGYVLVSYKDYAKRKNNSRILRFFSDEDEALYNASSMSRSDGVNYAIYSFANSKIIF